MSKPVAGSRLGIDVSHHQGKIDWQAVANSSTEWGPVEWAYAKASTGQTGRDKRFVENAVGASQAGLPMGAYHWVRPGYNPANAEARNFLEAMTAARKAGADLPLRPMIDLEEKPGPKLSGAAELRLWVDVFADEIENAWGLRPLLYVGSNYARQHLDAVLPPDLDVWIPQYNWTQCRYPAGTEDPKKLNAATREWSVWQICSRGHIPGIKGRVDLNVLRPGQCDAIGICGLGRAARPFRLAGFGVAGVGATLMVAGGVKRSTPLVLTGLGLTAIGAASAWWGGKT